MKLYKHLVIIAALSFSMNAFAYDYSYSDSTIKKQDAYGYGVHSDQYGRAVTIQPKNDYSNGYTDPGLKIKENKYGYGQHSDQYGRPVTIQPYGQ